jgi:3-oxoacyl-(acyl-carrier-protein) synthase
MAARVRNGRRIAITGLGVVSPVGIGTLAFWDGVFDGRSGLRPVTLFDTSGARSTVAAEIEAFDPAAIVGTTGLRLLDRTTRLALCAAKLALADAGLESPAPPAEEVGVALGTTLGSMSSRGGFCEEALRNGFRAVNPALFPNTVISSPASQVAIRVGVRAFNATISAGFTSSLVAMDYAAGALADGRATFVLAGGVEELAQHTFSAFDALGLLSPSSSGAEDGAVPFGARRTGAMLGEGAAIVVMEPMDVATERGATILAEYLGGAHGSDRRAYRRYPRRPERGAATFQRALDEAGVRAEDVDLIAAGANGSPRGDLVEAQALGIALKDRRPPAFAVKSIVGEPFSAGGAFQTAGVLGSFARNATPPTLRVEPLDPECHVDCSPGRREGMASCALVTSISPMGQSAAAVLARMEENRRG